MVGYDREDLLSGRVSWRELTPPEWQASNDQTLAELAATGVCKPFEREFFHKDGSRVPIMVGPALFEGTGNQGVAFVLDLTERKRAEEVLRQVQADLAHVSRVTTLGELTASIAHEVNQPLGAIVNYGNASLRLLSRGLEHFEEVKHIIAKIIGEANRASAVIAHARALSKKAPPEKVALDLKELTREVMALVRQELVAHAITAHVQCEETLPPVLGDRVQIQQVLLNLVINGIEAMSATLAQERTLTVRICLNEVDDGRGVLVRIQDVGVGLRQEDSNRLFEAFYTTKPKGLGMGLAISRSIVEAHGGKLWAEPNDGPGATFCVVLSTEPPNEP
jgi:PAS domain S-box-containing protein